MGQRTDRITQFLPLSAQDFQVLLVLKDEPLHGYGIAQTAESMFANEPTLEIGSLYRIVARLLDQGLIREIPPKSQHAVDGRKRRFYQTTGLGLQVARAEATRLFALLGSQPAVDLLEGN